MSANRKADLQRKLTSTPAPKPPAGLSERIKTEIPKHLRFNAEAERKRLSASVLFSMRVAASILLLISSLYLGMHLLSRVDVEQRPVAVPTARRAVSAQAHAAPPPAAEPTRSKVALQVAKAKEKRLKQEKPQSVVAANELKVADRQSAAVGASAGQVAEAAPAPSVTAKMATRAVTDSITVSASAPLVMSRASESVIQRFALPAALPSGTIMLDTEATRGRFDDTAIFLRASIDSGIAARDVRIEVLFNPDAAVRVRWLSGGWRWGTSSFADQSHTSLGQIAIAEVLDDSARIATVRLTYRIGEDASEHSVEKIIRRADIVSWSAASQRMKSASLAAEWATGRGVSQVAGAAREAGLNELAKFVEEAP